MSKVEILSQPLVLKEIVNNNGKPREGKNELRGAHADLIPGAGRSSDIGNDNPLQYSRLGDPMDRGTWQTTVHGVGKSQARLGNYTTTAEWLPSEEIKIPWMRQRGRSFLFTSKDYKYHHQTAVLSQVAEVSLLLLSPSPLSLSVLLFSTNLPQKYSRSQYYLTTSSSHRPLP